jgi:uncharacterized membrane protein YhaH (DUF805 family)
MEWMLLPYKRYADFSGRSRRKEYWMFFLFQMLVAGGVMLLASVLIGFSGDGSIGAIAGVILSLALVLFSLGSIIPGIAVAVRRMHDLDKSGWALLFGLIPLVGSIILLVWYCTEGTRGANRFGPDPKDPNSISAFT